MYYQIGIYVSRVNDLHAADDKSDAKQFGYVIPETRWASYISG